MNKYYTPIEGKIACLTVKDEHVKASEVSIEEFMDKAAFKVSDNEYYYGKMFFKKTGDNYKVNKSSTTEIKHLPYGIVLCNGNVFYESCQEAKPSKFKVLIKYLSIQELSKILNEEKISSEETYIEYQNYLIYKDSTSSKLFYTMDDEAKKMIIGSREISSSPLVKNPIPLSPENGNNHNREKEILQKQSLLTLAKLYKELSKEMENYAKIISM